MRNRFATVTWWNCGKGYGLHSIFASDFPSIFVFFVLLRIAFFFPVFSLWLILHSIFLSVGSGRFVCLVTIPLISPRHFYPSGVVLVKGWGNTLIYSFPCHSFLFVDYYDGSVGAEFHRN